MTQNSRSRFALQFTFLISLISLLPYLTFFFVVVPCSDDIFYHNYAQDKTVSEFMVHHYTTWTGRYFSNLMMAINPYTLTSNPHVYPWMMLSLFFIFTISLFWMLQTLSAKLNPDLTLKNSTAPTLGHATGMISIIALSLFFHKMPRTADSLYWFAGASSHLLPMSLVLISIGLYVKNLYRTTKNTTVPFITSILGISVFSFIICGSNETLAIQWLFTLMFGIFYHAVVEKRWEKSLVLPLLVAVIGFGILYLAPGNTVRAKELHGGHDIGLLLIKPWGLIIETTARYLSLSLLISALLFFPFLKSMNSRISTRAKEPRSLMLLGLFGLGLFALTFVPSVWTMGGLPPRRVLNNTYLLFLLYGTFLLILFAHKLDFLRRWSDRLYTLSNIQLKILIAVSSMFLFNHFYAWKDLLHLPHFLNSMEKRQTLVLANPHQDLTLPNLEYFPTTFFYEDITVKTDDYRNVVFSEFYKLKSVRLVKEYEE